MPVFRLVLLLVVLSGLALFIFSNTSPVLPLSFLGVQTAPLPFAAWLAVAIAAGFISSWLLQFLGYLRARYSPVGVSPAAPSPKRSRREEPKYTTTTQTRYTPPASEPAPVNDLSDWEVTDNDDWDIEAPPAPSTSPFPQPPVRDTTNYEVRQEPKTVNQSGSVYSQSYRDTRNSSVGKTEDVYDANYRLIVPPYQEDSSPERETDDEDWGFEEDDDEFDDFEDDNSPSRL
ncbi:MAG: hypothetical protein KME06_18415 [Kastovskya adunca ATA6-11-RM4]|jgi:uncharacterized membrane protein YciS (DUF1049 family)|nr:hypothetical protein [Kastovskya adunca ATA6-11-RM4]